MSKAATAKTTDTKENARKSQAGAKSSLSASSTPCEHEAHAGQSVCRDKIETRAYLKWEAAGCPAGDGQNFWLEAEAELVQEQAKQ